MWAWVLVGRNGAHSLGRIRPTNTKQHIAIGSWLRFHKYKGCQHRAIKSHRNLSSNVLVLMMHLRPQQQASKQASTSPFRFGRYFRNLANLEPRWCPCRIQVLSHKLTGGARGEGAKSRGALPKLRIMCPNAAFFGPKWPRNPFKTIK